MGGAARHGENETARVVAEGWERHLPAIEAVAMPVRDWLIRELEAAPGDTILELAAGSGDTGYETVTRIGDGRLITSDYSDTMLEVARRRGREVGIGDVDYRLIDAQHIELPDDSVDRVLCRFGYMLMPDPSRALAETRRVLRPGGRLALAVWAGPEYNPYFAILMVTLVGLGHLPPPDPAAPGPLSLGDEARLHELLADAGFSGIVIETVPVVFRFDDVDHYVTMFEDIAGPISDVLGVLSAAQRAEVLAAVREAAATLATDRGYEFPGLALCARAVNGQPL